VDQQLTAMGPQQILEGDRRSRLAADLACGRWRTAHDLLLRAQRATGTV